MVEFELPSRKKMERELKKQSKEMTVDSERYELAVRMHQ
jgi:hypothetical protein